eukprot:122112-Chlamydomonas_euryale.AAC.1
MMRGLGFGRHDEGGGRPGAALDAGCGGDMRWTPGVVAQKTKVVGEGGGCSGEGHDMQGAKDMPRWWSRAKGEGPGKEGTARDPGVARWIRQGEHGSSERIMDPAGGARKLV